MNLMKKIVMFILTICCMFALFGLNTEIKALDESTTYVFTSKSWEATNNGNVDNWTSITDGNGYYSEYSGVKVSIIENVSCANSPISYSNISKIIVNYCTNAGGGVGNVSLYLVDSANTSATNGTLIDSKAVTKTGGTTLRKLEFTPSSFITGFIQLHVNCTTNAIYINSIEIICYEDPIASFDNNTTKSSMILGYNTSYSDNTYSNELCDISFSTGSTYINDSKNYADLFGMNESLFFVQGGSGDGNKYPYINSSKDYVTLYSNNTNGSSLTISTVLGITISKVVITYSEATDCFPGTLIADTTPTTNGNEYTFSTPVSGFTIKNTYNATTGNLVRVREIKITYSGIISLPSYTISNIALRFGNCITKSMYDELNKKGNIVSYGVLAIKKTDLGTDELSTSLEKAKDFKCTPVRVDSIGAVEEDTDGNGNYYQFAGVIENIPSTAYGEEFVAACYVCIDGTYYLMQTATFSVNSLATQYVNAEDTSSYSAHLGVLNSIKG